MIEQLNLAPGTDSKVESLAKRIWSDREGSQEGHDWHKMSDETKAEFREYATSAISGLSQNTGCWQPMATAPTNGKHVILAIKSGPFAYAIQGACMMGKWLNAADIDVEPLCWMPNVMIPNEYLPWTDEFRACVENAPSPANDLAA